MRLLTIAFILIGFVSQYAGADAANDPTYPDADVSLAVHAVLAIPTDHAFLLALESVPAASLPLWDPIAHYAGPQKIPDGRTVYAVIVSDQYPDAMVDLGHSDHAVAAAVASAVFLSVMDAGRAGPMWKARYQKAADDDDMLPASISDRYSNRHALVRTLAETQSVVYASIGGGDSPAMDDFGNPLTVPIEYGSGLLQFARLGAAASRLIQLFEYASALKQHSSQAFVDSWFAEFGAALPNDELRRQLEQQRPLFVADQSANLQLRQHQFSQTIVSLLKHLNRDQTAAFGLGYDANEIRYNANAIKSADEDAQLRPLVGQTWELDGTLPKLKDLRQRLGALQAGDWTNIATLAGQIVEVVIRGS